MGFKDLRGWLDEVEKMGELKKVEGVHGDREIGAISEMIIDHGSPDSGQWPALFKHCPPGKESF
jgi:3-polyprenyl-4-hydroxybenzoate decarboxylase